MPRRKGISIEQILETLDDTDDDGLPEIDIEVEPEDDEEIQETEEVHYHEVDVLLENEVSLFYRDANLNTLAANVLVPT